MMSKLAIHGGQPIREERLSYGQQWISEEDIAAVVKTLTSPFLTQGPTVNQFEDKVALLVGAKYAVAFSNGTAALHGACYAAGIGEGDEVITTPLTFAASANCVLYQRGTPVFADINPETMLIDIKEVEKRITSKTKAVIAVDYTGQPVNMTAFKQLCHQHNLVFIQDAAHSLGASFAGQKVGSIADMTMFSFHPVKPVTTGEGGVITTNCEKTYQSLLLFRSHGITKEKHKLDNQDEGAWYHEMQELGYNYRLTDIQAALGLSQLNNLHAFIEGRNNIAQIYHSAFQELEAKGLIKLPVLDSHTYSGWHLYVIRLMLNRLSGTRNEVFDALVAEGIGVNVHYIPVYRHPYYQRLSYSDASKHCQHTEKVYKEIITLPLFPRMSQDDIQDVIQAVLKVVDYYKIS